MTEYKRENPLFSLCGLNCGLCPRYQSEGKSRCPGCGGPDFHLQHPTCAVITCSKKHGDAQYCFQCKAYPCDRYQRPMDQDSFITYRNVIDDMRKAKDFGIEAYQAELNQKVSILEFLIRNYNDGRKKNFYCLSVNLLPLAELCDIMEQTENRTANEPIPLKEKIAQIEQMFLEKAKSNQIDLTLRK